MLGALSELKKSERLIKISTLIKKGGVETQVRVSQNQRVVTPLL